MASPESMSERPLTWGVAALLQAVGDALSARFHGVVVRGELSGFLRAPSGHCYFSLKDAGGAQALIRCAMFRRVAAMVDFQPSDGQQVELRGRLAVYEPRGEFQFVVESLRKVGAGTLYEEFLRLKAHLTAQGLFDEQRKRPLPAFPKALGVVTSLGAAALRDVLTTLARRAPHVRVVIYPSLVQGAEAPLALTRALAMAANRHEVDALLLVRGGGSIEDLWSFNDERVVRAVASSPLPVVCGVGHETDVTLCDLAADVRAPTPTAAAELAAPLRSAQDSALQALQRALSTRVRHVLDRSGQRLDLLGQRTQRPGALLRGEKHRLDAFQNRLSIAARAATRDARARQMHMARSLIHGHQACMQGLERDLAFVASRLQTLHPQHVLRRGYAWVLDEQGRPITSAQAVHTGERITAQWSDGHATATVHQVTREP